MFFQKFCLAVLLHLQISGICSAATRNQSLIQSRVIAGQNADITDANFVASIRTRAFEEISFGLGVRCGGSLISENVVLTAAHCLLNRDTRKLGHSRDFLVVVGNLDSLKRDHQTLQYDIRKLVAADINLDLDHDIALVFLEGKVPNSHLAAKPVALNKGPLTDDIPCKTYGWGSDGNEDYTEMLQVVDLPLISLETCVAESDIGERVHSGMICAGHMQGGPAPCDGDSGGPLVCEGKQVGVFSFSISCGLEKRPPVFTNVALYSEWIEKHVLLNDATLPEFSFV